MVRDEPLLIRPPSCKKDGSVRRANRKVHVATVERHALARQLLEIRRLHGRRLRKRHRTIAVGVAQDIDDVGAGRFGGWRILTRRREQGAEPRPMDS